MGSIWCGIMEIVYNVCRVNQEQCSGIKVTAQFGDSSGSMTEGKMPDMAEYNPINMMVLDQVLVGNCVCSHTTHIGVLLLSG